MSRGRLLTLLAAAVTLAACGQKGALYLPAKATVVTRPATTNSAPSQPSHKDDKDPTSSTPPPTDAPPLK